MFFIIFAFILGLLGGLIFFKRKSPSKYLYSSTVFKILNQNYVKKVKSTEVILTADFSFDIKAKERHYLSQFIDEVLLFPKKVSQVILRVQSSGGEVAGYGQCAAEFERLKQAKITTIVCVDTVAASGGYLLIASASKIIAAPFAMIGSIGVVSFLPNIRKLLEKFSIQPRTYTAGEHKRTLTLTDNAGKEEEEVFRKKLTDIHQQFKAHVQHHRPLVSPESFNGDHWTAQRGKDLGLVDDLGTYHETLFPYLKTIPIYKFTFKTQKSWWKKIITMARANLN